MLWQRIWPLSFPPKNWPEGKLKSNGLISWMQSQGSILLNLYVAWLLKMSATQVYNVEEKVRLKRKKNQSTRKLNVLAKDCTEEDKISTF